MKDEVAECRRTWRRLGVPAAARDEMAEDLEAHLAAAREDGVVAEDVLGRPAAQLATEWAFARGLVRARLRLLSTVLTAILGTIPGVAFSLFVPFGVSGSPTISRIMNPHLVAQDFGPTLPTWLILALYGAGALFALAGSLGAVAAALRWAGDVAVGATLRALAITLPAGAVAGVAMASALGARFDYSYSRRLIAAEVLIAGVFLVAAAAAGRWIAVRHDRSQRAAHPAIETI